MLVVIDTNVLLVSISDRSKYHWLYKAIIDQKIEIAITNDILTEYEEQISKHWHLDVARDVTRSLIELSTAHLTVSYYHLNLILDEDDNKFVDCASAANAEYIVTNDQDFNILKTHTFPAIKVVTLEDFKSIITSKGISL